MREDQRDPTAAFVDKVDPHAVDLAAEVRELVQPPLLQAPVEPVSPVLEQPAHIAELGPLLPPRLGRRRRPARVADPLAQVGQRPLGNLNLEGLDVKRRHTAQILSPATLAARRPTTAVRPATGLLVLGDEQKRAALVRHVRKNALSQTRTRTRPLDPAAIGDRARAGSGFDAFSALTEIQPFTRLLCGSGQLR